MIRRSVMFTFRPVRPMDCGLGIGSPIYVCATSVFHFEGSECDNFKCSYFAPFIRKYNVNMDLTIQ